MNTLQRILCAVLLAVLVPSVAVAQHSVARQWNDALLEAIRHDYARPTVHARNLFHSSIAMYDAWAAYDGTAETFALGKTIRGFDFPFDGVPTPVDRKAAREKAVSFAMYRLLEHRFENSPGATETLQSLEILMGDLGYDTEDSLANYESGNPAALGNYIAAELIEFGFQDGANEANSYENVAYEPVNPTIVPILPGNPDIIDPNRWQPITLQVFIDQSGHVIPLKTPDFLSPEWGIVPAFALSDQDLDIYNRDGDDYWVYHDPGAPAYLDTLATGGESAVYKWNFELVAIWASHLDPADGVMWDISPGAVGNIPSFPTAIEDYPDFYDLFDGGDPSLGRAVNPSTGMPYEPNIVPRADYARVLAEFWADGPSSETPPGHWFTLLNYVNDHPAFEKRWAGQGDILDELEWDVKAYFVLAGAVHDAAVAGWGIKGWYDYVRPISAIRYLADRGQCSDAGLPSYDPRGINLVPGFIELVAPGDTLAGDEGQNVDKIKLYTWRGPAYITDPDVDDAGVGWILAENWWPYQRPTFITPPFAGYISGHSTFSRAAAVVMGLVTGDEYFPGGMGEFEAPQNEFLVFEEGPSVDVTLQWATYRDASDQCSLSRIWGGIHPPMDDMPGRLIGEELGADAFALAEKYYDGSISVPVLVTGFTATLVDGGVSLNWSMYTDEELAGFRIYRSEADGSGERVLTPQGLDVYTRSYMDRSAEPGHHYRYCLAAFWPGSSEEVRSFAEVESPVFQMELARNQPNPFNPSTTIRFTLPASDFATLRVYTLAGALVRTLVDGHVAAGPGEVTWHGTDDAGREVASGVYLYQLRSGGVVEQRKMVLVR